MTAVATGEPALAERPPTEAPAPRLFEPGGLTLEDVVLGVWEDLVARGPRRVPRLRWLDGYGRRVRLLRRRAQLSGRGSAEPRNPPNCGSTQLRCADGAYHLTA